MKPKTAPYINFQGRAREAMEFYHGIFGGELALFAAGDNWEPREAKPGEPIMYAKLEADDVVLIGSDGNPSYPPTPGDNIAIVLSGSDRPLLAAAFDKLGEGGLVKGPLRKAPWGGEAGWLRDKFGINWNVDVEAE